MTSYTFATATEAELFRAACKLRGVGAEQRFDTVHVSGPTGPVDHIARRYRLVSVDGQPATTPAT